MLRQYREIRESLPSDALLLFRLGDFYEMFGEDAKTGAALLGITLTKRNQLPMAGIPFHAADAYIAKALAAGRRVAICDQVETPKPGQLVRRSLTRILSPGTVLQDDQIPADTNAFLLALCPAAGAPAAAWLDLSTGRFELAGQEPLGDLLNFLRSLNPREVVLPRNYLESSHPPELKQFLSEFTVTPIDPEDEVSEPPARLLQETLGVLSLDGFGISADHPALPAAATVLRYATSMLRQSPANLRGIRCHRLGQQVLLDAATARNLEIFSTGSGRREGSLLHCLNATVTPAGTRLLESYLASPTRNSAEINRRLDVVDAFRRCPIEAAELREALSRTRDLQRIVSRLQNRLRNPREVGGIRDTLEALPVLRDLLSRFSGEALAALRARVGTFESLREYLQGALADELPGNLREGGVIRSGHHPELDRLRDLSRNARHWVAELEAAEREATGIRNLKIKFNSAFGYFIEITKSNIANVPDHYTRKQTVANAERYYTPDLKEKEQEILHAEERAVALEEQLFLDIIARVTEEAEALVDTGIALAEIDLLAAWAMLARQRDYCRPEVVDEAVIEIEAGRHPVIEESLRQTPGGIAGTESFVANDCILSGNQEQIALITGPNMAGKSTYIRQVALLTLLAHIGCPVPARRCRVGLVDRIFSRVGASDELARGNSTFMVEMNETANILNNATNRSLIILDEIGRGTSTFDGLSIAWAIMEHLHADPSAGPCTLFATHYHELTRLAESLPRLRNFSVAVKEWNDRIVFVRQVIPGAADRSYGIQVARLAGLPDSVLGRAREILESLENDGTIRVAAENKAKTSTPAPRPVRTARREAAETPGQLNLF